MKIEREFRGRVELRDGDGELPDIVGLAAPFYDSEDTGTEFRLWSGAVERIMPSAFDASLDAADDIYASFNHNADNVLARTAAGTMKLAKTKQGLEYAVRANDASPFYRDLVSRIERGDVAGSSITFSIRANGVEWIKSDSEDGPEVRELHSVQLYELGPVVSPAYTATAAGLRDGSQLSEARDSWRAWQVTQKPLRRESAKVFAESIPNIDILRG